MLLKMVAMMNENLYAVFSGTEAEPTFRYVGKTVLTVEERWKQHLRGARDGVAKELYEAMRMEGIDTFSVLELDNSDGQTEQDYVTLLIEMSHPLLNSNMGNSKVAKRPNRTFDTINRQAMERTAPRQILHGLAQQLPKSQMVAAKIRNDFPTIEQLLAAEWRACPPEQLGTEVARTAERAEYTKIGYVSCYIAFKDKDRMMSLMARHYDGRENRLAKPMWYGPKAKRETLMLRLVEGMNIDWYWQKPYAASL
jgi:hypothetical protein